MAALRWWFVRLFSFVFAGCIVAGPEWFWWQQVIDRIGWSSTLVMVFWGCSSHLPACTARMRLPSNIMKPGFSRKSCKTGQPPWNDPCSVTQVGGSSLSFSTFMYYFSFFFLENCIHTLSNLCPLPRCWWSVGALFSLLLVTTWNKIGSGQKSRHNLCRFV